MAQPVQRPSPSMAQPSDGEWPSPSKTMLIVPAQPADGEVAQPSLTMAQPKDSAQSASVRLRGPARSMAQPSYRVL